MKSYRILVSVQDFNCISGICISPDRLRDISTAVGNSAIEMFEQDRIVYPIGMAHGCFTVGAVDNIDVNTSSSTAMSSFHGTAASLHQKRNDSQIHKGTSHTVLSKESKLRNLPDYYTEIQPYCPSSNTSASPFVTQLPENVYLDVHKTEEEWLNSVQESKDSVSNSWAVFNAS